LLFLGASYRDAQTAASLNCPTFGNGSIIMNAIERNRVAFLPMSYILDSEDVRTVSILACHFIMPASYITLYREDFDIYV